MNGHTAHVGDRKTAREFSAAEHRAMDAAFDAALLGARGANPLVGAALIGSDDRVLHVGHHRGSGSPHAEIDVLSQARRAGTDLSKTTLVVTLEPCDHQGRTGPCSQAVIDSGVRRVVYALSETTDTASGGAAALRTAGVEVDGGLLTERSLELNHRWIQAQTQGRPFVTVKTAQSLDGRIAAEDGTSQWITGSAARRHAHQVRGRVEAIVVGTGTVLADDPRLTVRHAEATQTTSQTPSPPLRVAMGYRQVPTTARIRGTDGRFRQVNTHDPDELLAVLSAEGARHVLVEGGSEVVGAFLAADRADELMIYQAPLLLGAGRMAYPHLGINTLDSALRYLPDPSDGGTVRQLAEDMLWHLQPEYQPESHDNPPAKDSLSSDVATLSPDSATAHTSPGRKGDPRCSPES